MRPSRLALASLLLTLLALALLLTLASPGLASDGVREINQACALQTGCLSGDAAAFPVTITTPGSYALTSNLVVPDENTTAIAVTAPSVSIDLNGFEIVRAGCEGASVDCTPAAGTGSGVDVTTSLLPGVSVENGSITGMGRYGVSLEGQAVVRNLRVRWNRLSGITVYAGAIVSGNSVYENGDRGILASIGSIVSDNVVYRNGGDGIYAASGSTVSGNSVYQNGQDGITTQSGVIVSGNSVRWNGELGLNLFFQTTYRENTVTGNATGTVFSGVNRGDNYCEGPGVVSAFCP